MELCFDSHDVENRDAIMEYPLENLLCIFKASLLNVKYWIFFGSIFGTKRVGF